MKTKILVTLTLLIATVSFSQKTEIKAAEKALKAEDAATAKSTLEGISSTICLLYTSPSPRDQRGSRMPSSA